jgi:DNA-directed RNA polymerase subunit K/omega
MSAEGDDEYSAALDNVVGGAEDAGPEEADDTGAEAIATAEALGITEAPSQKTQGLLEAHPELYLDYEEAVMEKLVIREAYPPIGNPDAEGKMPNHTTYPFLTLYERTKVLSLRASQLAHGAPPFIDVPEYLTDVYEIARAELDAKRLPYILGRLLPDGVYEYWRLADLMIL